MSRYWIDPTRDYLIALCDGCASDPETERAKRERGWIEIPRNDPRVREEGAFNCSVCGDYL
ncbi:hypothetical protein [Thermoflexus sp.]|uniref:hypothetical protein n=1 Tax=Thermoflexus sp. TaxID=1969742 RepID=UPI002ADE3279|nr:hypothetical protein [Thermoflexus sp.]